MPRKDGTGPAGSGPRDGVGKRVGGKGRKSTQKGQDAKRWRQKRRMQVDRNINLDFLPHG